MADTLNVRLTGKLRKFVDRQTGPEGMFESVSEYIRTLIRQDYDRQDEQKWQWLYEELEPGMKADESEFVNVSADDVIKRNRKKRKA